jgi:hypothetical protein
LGEVCRNYGVGTEDRLADCGQIKAMAEGAGKESLKALRKCQSLRAKVCGTSLSHSEESIPTSKTVRVFVTQKP